MSGDLDNAVVEQGLEAAARQGADVIRGKRARNAAAVGLEEALVIVLALLGLMLVFRLLGSDLSRGQILGWSLSIGALWIPLRAAFASMREVPRRSSLMEVDRQLLLKDRLTTAEQFLGAKTRTPFMELAVQDAMGQMEKARSASLSAEGTPWTMSSRVKLLAGIALLLALVTLNLGDLPTTAPSEPDGVAKEIAEQNPDDRERPDQPRDRVTTPPPAQTEPIPPRNSVPGRPGKEAAPPTRDVKKSRGKTGLGQSADAASSSGRGEARGTPSSQGQSTTSSKDRTKKKPKKPKKRPERPQEPDKERKAEDQSGHTTGRGAASGSNKSPAASEWSSKDQVTSDDEEDLEDDEEVDDEFDNSDARGGLQPQLRDRKPPVNRDLGIGFGNGKDPDANGRGGPSQRKKSRGVASLVLGVPIPDHIKGRPNPGKTKITQERVEPQPEDMAQAAAQPRRPRAAPAGHLSRPELAPWMQDLVRTYFGTLRKTSRNLP